MEQDIGIQPSRSPAGVVRRRAPEGGRFGDDCGPTGWPTCSLLSRCLALWSLWPIRRCFALYSSFWKFNNFKFVALDSPFDNYTRALGDRMIRRAFVNAFELFAISFTGGQVLALLVAVLLNSIRRGVGLFRTLYYIPW